MTENSNVNGSSVLTAASAEKEVVFRDVEIPLERHMRAATLETSYGVDRAAIADMFSDLDAAGFGEYKPASRGRGACATFTAKEGAVLPEVGICHVRVKRAYTKRAEGTTGKGKFVIPAIAPNATRFLCVVAGDVLSVVRVPIGAETVEGAVMGVWGEVEPHVPAMATADGLAEQIKKLAEKGLSVAELQAQLGALMLAAQSLETTRPTPAQVAERLSSVGHIVLNMVSA
jgi:hypothetical protein